jgi:molecular chaperone DnaJ
MDFYQIIGVSEHADPETITKAYRLLAKKYHPDRNIGDEDAKIKYLEVAEAYEVLSDPLKRAEYNSRGFVGRSSQFKQEHRKSTGTTAERDDNFVQSASRRYRASGEELNSIDCQFFGGNELVGRNVLLHLTLPAADMRSGCVRGIKWKKREKCKTCTGYGSADLNKSKIIKCKACNGSGNVMQIFGKTGSIYPKCDFCDGSGALDVFCKECNGTGLSYMVIEEMMVEIPFGTQPGHQIVIKGRGEPGLKGGIAGNLHVLVLEEPPKKAEIK